MNDRIERETVPQMEGRSCHTYRDVQKYPKTRQEFDTTKPKNIRNTRVWCDDKIEMTKKEDDAVSLL